jgi:hypothetical protein
MAEVRKPHVRISNERWTILINVRRSRSDDSKTVISGRDPRRLNLSSHYVVNERRFPGRVVSNAENKREGRCFVAVLLQRSS